ncbi:hypothetical protein ONZ45_g5991 [Pleurotus djamor]|nr:hypothetical protein ONZ45_g5991 [Pleurotus djamor]
MSLLVLSAKDVAKVTESFEPTELENLMSTVFTTLSDPETPDSFSPARTIIPTENHKVLFMPSRMPNIGTSIKVVSVPLSAAGKGGLPATTMIIDETSGAIKAIVNARSLTALRNAAGSLLSTRLVGLENPTSIAAFGAGKQIEVHLDLHLRAYPSILRCTIVNRSSNSRLSALHDFLAHRHPSVRIECIGRDEGKREFVEGKVRECVGQASIIICATSSTKPLFPSDWVRDGTHIILIGSYTPQMREVDTPLILRSTQSHGETLRKPTTFNRLLLVDSWQACSEEAGELIDAKVQREAVIEIGEFVKMKKRGVKVLKEMSESHDGGITIFKSVGVGMQDVAIACATVEKASSMIPRVGAILDGYDE